MLQAKQLNPYLFTTSISDQVCVFGITWRPSTVTVAIALRQVVIWLPVVFRNPARH
jgi:hypothetical protein